MRNESIFGSWIVGPRAVEKVNKLKVAYFTSRIRQSEKKYGVSFKGYHPLMGVLKPFDFLNQEDIFQLQKAKIPIDFDPVFLRVRVKVYHQLPFLNWFQSGVMTIDEAILQGEPQAESEVWSAIDLISSSCPWMFEILNQVLIEVCPVAKNGQSRFVGGSSDNHLIGTIFTSLKPGDCPILDLGISLVHELGHNVLMLFEAGMEIVSHENRDSLVYSAIRKTERPVYGSFHACVALTYMALFARSVHSNIKVSERVRKIAFAKYQEYTSDLIIGLDAFADIGFSIVGKKIFDEMKRVCLLLQNP